MANRNVTLQQLDITAKADAAMVYHCARIAAGGRSAPVTAIPQVVVLKLKSKCSISTNKTRGGGPVRMAIQEVAQALLSKTNASIPTLKKKEKVNIPPSSDDDSLMHLGHVHAPRWS